MLYRRKVGILREWGTTPSPTSMIVIITLFYISLVVIVGMIAWKLVEIREVKMSLIEGIEKDLHGKLYEVTHEVWHKVRTVHFVQVRHIALMVYVWLERLFFRLVVKLAKKLQVRQGKLYDMVQGKGVINSKGSVSFFLKEVSSYKGKETHREE